jgi:hypothetical protein
MGKTSSAVKQKWNEANYRQIKIMISPEKAEAFKTACAEADQTMNATLSRYIEGYCQKGPLKTPPVLRTATRPQRRKTLQLLLGRLQELRDAEFNYQESIPENLRGSIRYEQSEQSVEKLDEAIALLGETF